QPFRPLQLHRRAGKPTYGYYFDQAAPLPASKRFRETVPPGGYGAFHGSEIWYVFNTLGAKPYPWTEQDRALAQAMGAYWVNFARTGDPNGAELPAWPTSE